MIYISISYYFQSYDLALLNAAKDRDLEGVMSALKNGADVNYKDEVSGLSKIKISTFTYNKMMTHQSHTSLSESTLECLILSNGSNIVLVNITYNN